MDKVTQYVFRIIKDKGITIIALSEKTNIPYQVLTKCAQGRRKLRADEFFEICKYASIDTYSLFSKFSA